MPKPRSSSPGAYQRDLFRCVPFYSSRLVRERTYSYAERERVCTPASVARLVQPYYADKDREEFLVLLLDMANSVVGASVISTGGLSASIVEARQVFKVAILANAAALVLVHNHPSGNPEPSREDVRVTKQLAEAGKLLGIPVHDHIVVVEDTYTSLAERGLMH